MIAENNPGNIRYYPAFKGCVGSTKGFCKFSTLGFGYRAILTLLTTYYTKYGLTTIRGIVSRYAPPSENNTESYINLVSRKTGFAADKVLQKEDLIFLIPAMVLQENSINVNVETVERLIAQANSPSTTIGISLAGTILALYLLYKWLAK
jgi:hypothetical protein